MNKEEAIRLVISAYPDRDVAGVTENDKYFLVNTVSKKRSDFIQIPQYDDGLKAVDKTSKIVFTYNPIRHG